MNAKAAVNKPDVSIDRDATVKIPPLGDRFHLREHLTADFVARFPVGIAPEDVMKPECWTNVAAVFAPALGTSDKPKIGSHIHCTTDDLAWEMDVTVRAVHKQSLGVSPYYGPIFHGPRDVKEDDRYKMRWNVGKNGWDVIRKIDSAVVADGKTLPTKEDAIAWIAKA